MAYEIPGVVVSLLSGSTTLKQYRICRLSAANTVVQTTGVSTGTAAIISVGVSQVGVPSPTTRTGLSVPVMISGVTKIEASTGAMSAGAFVRAASGSAATKGGKAIASSNSSPRIIGIALTSAAAATTASVRLVSVRLF